MDTCTSLHRSCRLYRSPVSYSGFHVQADDVRVTQSGYFKLASFYISPTSKFTRPPLFSPEMVVVVTEMNIGMKY